MNKFFQNLWYSSTSYPANDTKRDLFQIQKKKGQLITVQIIQFFIKFCLKILIKYLTCLKTVFELLKFRITGIWITEIQINSLKETIEELNFLLLRSIKYYDIQLILSQKLSPFR